jgi:hypothetical protein
MICNVKAKDRVARSSQHVVRELAAASSLLRGTRDQYNECLGFEKGCRRHMGDATQAQYARQVRTEYAPLRARELLRAQSRYTRFAGWFAPQRARANCELTRELKLNAWTGAQLVRLRRLRKMRNQVSPGKYSTERIGNAAHRKRTHSAVRPRQASSRNTRGESYGADQDIWRARRRQAMAQRGSLNRRTENLGGNLSGDSPPGGLEVFAKHEKNAWHSTHPEALGALGGSGGLPG